MAAPAQGEDSDDGMDAFMETFKTQKYKNAFNENNWEEVRPVTFLRHNNNAMSMCVNVSFTLVKYVHSSAYTMHYAFIRPLTLNFAGV